MKSENSPLLFNLKKYKQAVVMIPHLDAVIHLLSVAERGLSYYTNLVPVLKILLVIKEQKFILQEFKEDYHRYVKGRKI